MSQNQIITSIQKSRILNVLLLKIEEQLNWGSSKNWSGADFEKLSDLIYEKSQQRLSVTTLKRTWGRTSQSVKPSNTTLNMLADFAGAMSWRDFQSSQIELTNGVQTADEKTKVGRDKYYLAGGLMLGMVIVFVLMGVVYSDNGSKENLDFEDVKFEVQKVTQGIPNTVVFRYNIGSSVIDSLELQQSWDKRKRILLDPFDSLITTTYFEPGYFNAKLIADGVVIKRQDLYLPSDGLEVMVYLKDEEIPLLLSKDHWSIGSKGFQLANTFEASFNNQTKESILIVNLLEEPTIDADTFEFATSFRMTKEEEGDPCHPITIIITGSEDVYMFGLGNPGCAGKFKSYLGEKNIDGKYVDLSLMGFREDEWVDVEVSKKGISVIYKCNGKEIILSETAQHIGHIGGVRIHASQKISLRQFEMEDKDQLINLLQE